MIRLRADDDGPDLLGVLIGSEGTLAILTEATVALRPIAPVTRSLMGSFNSAQEAAQTISAIIKTGTVPAALEWMDRAGIAGLQQCTDMGYPTDADAIVLIDVDGTAEEVDHDAGIVEKVLRETALHVRRATTRTPAPRCGTDDYMPQMVHSGKGFFSIAAVLADRSAP